MTDPVGYDENDLEIMAKTLWGEARGEGHDGMIAVAWVIRNRMVRRNLSAAEVCLQPWQFSCWNVEDPNEPKLLALSPDEYADQYDIANDVLNGLVDDPTNGADEYFAPQAMDPPGRFPYWASRSKQVAAIGHQLFFDSRLNP